MTENATNPVNTRYNSTTKGDMFQITHQLNGQTINESRYIGDEPNNYVYFNCDKPQEGVEYNYATSCEVWRIIGVFDVDDGHGNVEKRMKLVRNNEFVNTMVFDSDRKNDWTVSPLKTFLNDDYYHRTGDATDYGLKELAQNMIDDAVYYLGAVQYKFVPPSYSYGTTEQIYEEERGNTVCGACNSDTTKLTWTGKVGLMYPSDEYMVYGNGVNATCYNSPMNCQGTDATTGWVFNSNIREGELNKEYTWFVSSRSGNSYYMLRVDGFGRLQNNYSHYRGGVRPVVYLKSNVKIFSGTGEEENPYKLSGFTSASPSSYASYTIGTTINYNNENYCVIRNSTENSNYVTAIKQAPLSFNELINFNNGYEIGRDDIDNNIGTISYYKSDTCYYNSDSDKNNSGCINNYNNSFIKNVVDNWSSSFNDDLIEISRYKARLLTTQELTNIGYEPKWSDTDYIFYQASDDLNECFNTQSGYWAMGSLDDNQNSGVAVGNSQPEVYNMLAVRPVINLKKCALNGTC